MCCLTPVKSDPCGAVLGALARVLRGSVSGSDVA